MTTEQLYEIIQEQQKQINDLEQELFDLKKWSDDNDYFLREMIDALTDSVDDLADNHCQCEVYRERCEKRQLAKKKARVIKVAKPAQDKRFDIPAFGLRTLKTMHKYI